MRNIFMLFLISALVVASCHKERECNPTPSCIEKKIRLMKAEPKRNPAGRVVEYIYNGEKVYFVSSDCCDQYDELYDSNCNLVCHPSGGKSSSGDGKCPDFFSNAKELRVIWLDERE